MSRYLFCCLWLHWCGAGLVGLWAVVLPELAIAQVPATQDRSSILRFDPCQGLNQGGQSRLSMPEGDALDQGGAIVADPMEECDFPSYRLGPGDSIFVGVQRFPDLSFEATLDLRGNVVMPLGGSINLVGLTPEQAERRIYDRYNQYVVNPDIAVILTGQRPVEVTVVGEVPRPGFHPLTAPQLSTALLSAGGTTTEADLRRVRIERSHPSGRSIHQTIDLFKPLQQGRALPQVRLQDGDVVTVPRLTHDNDDDYDRALVARSTLARPEIVVRVLNRAGGGRGIEARFGAVTLPNGSRFLDALALAQVNPDLAAYDRIAVIRFNPETESADTIMVDAAAAIAGDMGQNIALQDNDVLVVDRNLLARVTYGLNVFTQPFRDVLGFLLFFDSLANAADSLFRP
ncbi:polysaccharide biosynthesis/export family protein [Nodosilinea sp. P-1105]|uniref:polysaccharide biosynthesis/export family protein n=1 Tax=Nodosilinea sp. P-1105 TaxID=2546229 RepID=UPI0032428B51